MTTTLAIIKAAMRKCGAIVMGQDPTAGEAQDCLFALNSMIASWSNDSLIVYARTLEGFSLSGGVASYTIGPSGVFNTTRPVRIISAYIRSGSLDYSLSVETEESYDATSLKSIGDIPECLVYTPSIPLGLITLYGTPTAADTLYIRTEKPFTSLTLNQDLEFPPGWERALVFNLVSEIASEYGQSVPPEVYEVAKESKAEIRRSVMASKPMNWETGGL